VEISIIVPHHSNRTLLEFCLATLKTTVPADVEILVVANNVDGAKTDIHLDLERFRLLRFFENLGYGAAINAGAAEARGRLLIFCDDDTAFTPGWLAALVRFHRDTPTAGTVSAKLIAPTTGRIVDYGIAFTEYNAPHPFMDSEPGYPLLRRPRHVQAACSAVMLIERDLFEQVGGFVERPHAYYNDIDLCLRVAAAGRESWVIPNAVAFHRSSFHGTNSAPYKGTSLKADQKAWFMARHGAKLRVDMDRYFHESFEHLRANEEPSGEYILVDLSSVVDRKWHQELIAGHVSVRDTYEYNMYTRDSVSISLIEHLGPNLAALRVPFVYFVDRFVSLIDNAGWANVRDVTWDMVVDRNANVRLLRDVLVERSR